jgi:hypothetical protein
MTGRRVRIALTRSGGFGGMTTQIALDSTALPPDEAETVERLVDRLDLAAPPEVGRSRPDEFHYDLEIVRDHEQAELSLPEHALTPEMRELVTYVLRHGRDSRSRP